jgi:hypothetical protein
MDHGSDGSGGCSRIRQTAFIWFCLIREHPPDPSDPWSIAFSFFPEETTVMRRTLAGAVLAAVLLSVTGCGGSSTEAPKYKDPGLGIKPLPSPGSPGAPQKGSAASGPQAK